MSIIIIKLFILLFPGLFSVLIIRKYLVPTKKIEGNDIIIYTTIFGFVSYLLFQSFENLFGSGKLLSIWQNVVNEKNIIEYKEVIITSLVSLILSIIYVLIKNKKWDFALLNFLNVTDEISDTSLFSHYTNEFKTVYIIDFELKVAYLGNLLYHCETETCKEVGLKNVTIFSIISDENGISYVRQILDNQNDLYLAFPQSKSIVIINSEKVKISNHV
ncbi:MAG: hypothetical protein H7X99_05320 [Saprospiraceae bacterium]|nr:hypothetical protein [Saprospiraceae bacterium]